MDIFTVSLFGHRRIDDLRNIEVRLTPLVKELIRTKSYVSFMIGRKGEFDEYAASVIKHVQKEISSGNSELTLVLPYAVADIEYLENYYDNVIIPEEIYGAYPKSAITINNRWMIDHSDLVIVYVERNNGGAYASMSYARRQKKEIVNIAFDNI